jgi:ligand-binding sensor domain-containing protein
MASCGSARKAASTAYDSYRVTQYRHEPGNPNSLGDDYVQTLFEDSRGGIWAGTSVLSKFDPDTETFTRYPLPSRTSQSGGGIWAIREDQQGFLWVASSGNPGLYRFDPRTSTFVAADVTPDVTPDVTQDTPQETAGRAVEAMHRDKAGVLWLGTPHGLVRFDPATGTAIPYLPNSATRIRGIAADQSGKLWLATFEGAQNLFDPLTRTFTRSWGTATPPGLFGADTNQTVYADPGDAVWLGSNQGLKAYSPRNGTLATLRNQPGEPIQPERQ